MLKITERFKKDWVYHLLFRLVHKNKIELEEITIPVGRHFKDAVDQFLQSKGAL